MAKDKKPPAPEELAELPEQGGAGTSSHGEGGGGPGDDGAGAGTDASDPCLSPRGGGGDCFLPAGSFGLTARQPGWKKSQPEPWHSGIAMADPAGSGRMWVLFGGSDPARRRTLYIYDTAAFRWSSVEMTGDVPETAHSHCSGVWKGHLFAWGGYGLRGFSPSLRRMCCTSLGWERLDAAVEGSVPDYTGAASAVCDGTLYCFGGRSSTGRVTGGLYALSLGALRWTLLDSTAQAAYDDTQQALHHRSSRTVWDAAPLPRYDAAMAVRGTTLFVFGGHDGSCGSGEPLESSTVVFSIDVSAGVAPKGGAPPPRWCALRTGGDPPPAGVHGHVALWMGDALLCVGGALSPLVHAFDPDTLEWCIPPVGAGGAAEATAAGSAARHPPPLRVAEACQVRTPARAGPHKGDAWAAATVTGLGEDGTYSVHLAPTKGCRLQGAQTGVPRGDLRKVSRPLFPQRCACAVQPVGRRAFVVFGGLAVESNQRFQDTHYVTLAPLAGARRP